MMRFLLLTALLAVIPSSLLRAQQQDSELLVLNGEAPPPQIPELSRILNRLWLFPEDYEGKKVQLKSFRFEAENIEPCPELKGYLFSCEPNVFGHNDQERVHVGNARHISLDKLNFFCSDEQGQAIRNKFKQIKDDPIMAADVTLDIRKSKDGTYLGALISFEPRLKASK